MIYRRLHIRVPASGEVTFLTGEKVILKTRTENISAGGIGMSASSHILDKHEYQVKIYTESHDIIRFFGVPVYQSENGIGIKITSITEDNLDLIYRLIEGFQLTEDFIKHIDQNNIIDDWFTDGSGNKLEVTFESSKTPTIV